MDDPIATHVGDGASVNAVGVGGQPHAATVLSHTVLAHLRMRVDVPSGGRSSHKCNGAENPSLGWARSHSGSGGSGAPAKYCLHFLPSTARTGAIWRRNQASTSGVRTSSEWAMEAQSVSRRSWLRI